jgi:glycosyltransferase involved in cell wall biosynthesis
VKILLVESYYGGSHRAWADGYRDHTRHDVTLVTHEARFWKWRMHGAHLTLADEASWMLDAPPDVLLISSMLNVPAFIGAARRVVGDAPVAVYFHESQFAYPLSALDRPDQTYPMINWASAAAAELPIFNSEYHRALFFDRARRFLRQFPDHRHGHLVDAVEERSIVLPVGVDLERIGAPAGTGFAEPPLVLWNQRWEYDKNPAQLFDALRDGRYQQQAD